MRKSAPLSVLIVVLAAELSPSRMAMATPRAKPDYSKEAAVIEYYRTVYRFENDGTGTHDVTARIKIQSPAGVQQYGVLVFTYSSAFQRLQIGYVRVVQPDGTIVATTHSSFQDVTPTVTLNAPEYTDYRQKQVAVKGLVPGSELEYHVRFLTYAPLIPGQFELSYDFVENAVMLDEELVVSVPKGRATKVRNSRAQPTVTTKGNRRFYIWKHSNTKVRKQRRYPEGQARPPDVLLSSFQSWAQVGEWWRRIVSPQEASTPAIRAKAAQLTKGLSTEQQKLQAIYSYVAEQFRYVSISLGIGHYRPHSAAQVLANRYGDCKDKATLLASLLHAAGIEGWTALISSAQRIDPAVPSLEQFDHAITVVPEDTKLQWMDATTELAPLGLLTFDLRGKRALVVPDTQPAYLAVTPLKPSVPNRATFRAEGKLGSDGTFKGKMHYTLEGDQAIGMRQIFNSVAESQWPRTVQEIVRDLGFGGTVSHVQVSSPEDTTHPFSFSCRYVRKDYSQWAYQRILPPLPLEGPRSLPPSDAKAPQPFILGDPKESDYSASLELPKGYSPQLPEGLDLTTPFGSYHSAYSFKNGVLKAERRASTTAEQVPTAKFETYRKFQKAVSSDIDEFIGLHTGAAAGSPDTEFQEDVLEAYVREQEQEYNDALDHISRALKLKPDSALAWQIASGIYEGLDQNDNAIAAMSKAASLAPHSIPTYQLLNNTLIDAGAKEEEIIQLWRDYIRRNPKDEYGHTNLGHQFVRMHRYAEAVPEFEACIKMDPHNWWAQMQLAYALGHTGDYTREVAEFEKLVSLHPAPDTLNDGAYALAKAGMKLPEAEQWALRAVKAVEKRTGRISLGNLKDDDLTQMPSLAAYWDTLGWVYFHEGKIDEAHRYETASFALEQSPVDGDHLGQIEEKLGRKSKAIDHYAWAVVLDAGQTGKHAYDWNAPDSRQRLVRIAGSDKSFERALRKARKEISRTQSYRIRAKGLMPGKADFFVLLAPGEKTPQVKFVSGSQNLRRAAGRLSMLHYGAPFPDDGPARLLRRGVLTCSKAARSCHFDFYTVDSVHSVK